MAHKHLPTLMSVHTDRHTHTHEFQAICQHDTTTRVMTTDLNVSKDHILPEELCGYSCARVCACVFYPGAHVPLCVTRWACDRIKEALSWLIVSTGELWWSGGPLGEQQKLYPNHLLLIPWLISRTTHQPGLINLQTRSTWSDTAGGHEWAKVIKDYESAGTGVWFQLI